MPAKTLTEEQLAEAAALKDRWKKWQERARDKGDEAVSQEAVALKFGFNTQSALNQYLNGYVPLNPSIVMKFAKLFGVKPEQISPIVVAAAQEKLADLLALTAAAAPKIGLVAVPTAPVKYKRTRRDPPQTQMLENQNRRTTKATRDADK